MREIDIQSQWLAENVLNRAQILLSNRIQSFLLRDAMQARSMQCPSVTFVDHVETNKHIFQFFSQSVATPF